MRFRAPIILAALAASASAALGHPGPRVWVNVVDGKVTTSAGPYPPGDPANYSLSRVFTQMLIDDGDSWNTDFPGYQMVPGGSISEGTNFSYNIAGPLLFFDDTAARFEAVAEYFAGAPAIPQLAVTNELFQTRVTGAGFVTGDLVYAFNGSSGDHNHLSHTLLGDGVNPVGGPNGIYALPMQLAAGGITASDTYYLLFGKNVSRMQLDDAAGAIQPPQWIRNGGGSWGEAANWDGGIPNSTSASANFLGALTTPNAPAIITLDGDRIVGAISFDNANTYEIAQGASGTLTVASVTVTSGQHRISAPLVLAANVTAQIATGASLQVSGNSRIADNQSLTASGPGLLIISGPQDHGQSTTLNVNGGQVRLDSNAGFPGGGPAVPKAVLSLNLLGDGSQVILGADQDLRAISIDASAEGQLGLDLNSAAQTGAFRSLRIHAQADVAAQTKQTLYAAISHARSNPSDGIFDSGLAAHPSSAIGIALVDDPRGWQYLLIRPTRIGDLNLDGIVTIADFLGLASNFNSSGAGTTWQEGDVNYDNRVTIADFLDLAANFNAAYADSGSDATIPEPSMLWPLALSSGMVLLRCKPRG